MHFATRKRSLGQGNMFTGVCLSTGRVPDQVPPQTRYPPGADTPPEQTPPSPGSRHHPPDKVHPQEQTPPRRRPPRSRHPLLANTPRSRHPREQTHPPEQTPPREQTPSLCRACWEIRSMRGRYASYWNAILFFQCHQFLSNRSAQHFELSDYQNYWYTI